MTEGSETAGGSGSGDPSDPTRVRVRGIYTTALTALFEATEGFAAVQPSPSISDRFDDALAVTPADVRIETTRDRQGVAVSGDPDAVAAVADELEAVGIDAFRWTASVPTGAVYDAEVVDTRGGGAILALGETTDRRGYLSFDAVDGYVDVGDRYRVQVRDPTPPWADDHPGVGTGHRVETGLCTLDRSRTGVSADAPGERATELIGLTDLLSASPPAGWGLRWRRRAVDADVATLEAALERANARADALETALAGAPDDPGDPARLAAPAATAWVWFGRESRTALDDRRRTVAPTMVGHHRIKAGSRSASAGVDFVEAVCGSAGVETDGDGGTDETAAANGFPFGAVADQFGPREGDRIELGHGKPDGRVISLGTGEVTAVDADGAVTVRRELRGGGTYDALGTPKETGDVAVTRLREGRWWYATHYEGADGESKGTYVNVCTPVECFPEEVRYVDCYVDVIRRPDGTVAVVDQAELDAAVDEGLVSTEVAEQARRVAASVERALSK